MTGVGRRLASDDGAIAVVTLLALVLFTTGVLAGLAAAGDLSLTAARARTAADAAALAGMSASPLVAAGGLPSSPARAADRTARANGGRVVVGDLAGWPLRYRVTVEVDPATAWVRRVAGPVRAQAVAAVRPRPDRG